MGLMRKAMSVGMAVGAFTIGAKACHEIEPDNSLHDVESLQPESSIKNPLVTGLAPAAESTIAKQETVQAVEVKVIVTPDGKHCSIKDANGQDVYAIREGSRLMATTDTPGASMVFVDGNNYLRSDSDITPLNLAPTPVDVPSQEEIPAIQCFTKIGTDGVKNDEFDPTENVSTVPVVDNANVVADNLNVPAFEGGNLTQNIQLGGLSFP